MIETIPIKGLWGILSKLPGLFLKAFFPAQRLSQLIYVDLQPRSDPAVVQLGQVATFTLYLQIINLSPFSVELDRANFKFLFGGVSINTSILKKQIIQAGEIATIYINDAIPDGHANQIAQHHENSAALEGNIEFNCKVRSFAKNIGHLSGVNPRIYNANLRSQKQ